MTRYVFVKLIEGRNFKVKISRLTDKGKLSHREYIVSPDSFGYRNLPSILDGAKYKDFKNGGIKYMLVSDGE